MDFVVENLKGLWKRIVVTFPCTVINEMIYSKFVYLSKTIRVNGFRVGKVPISFLEKKYGTIIRQEMLRKIMDQCLNDLILQKKINPISNPRYDVIHMCDNDHQNFIFSIVVEVYPKIQLKALEEIIIEKPVVTVTENDIDQILYIAKKQQIYWEYNNELVDFGNRVTFGIIMKSDNISMHNNYRTKNIVMVIGNHTQILNNLEKNLIGCKIGEKFDIEIDIPNNYYLKNFRNKRIFCTIVLKKIETSRFSKLHRNYFKHYNPKQIRENIQYKLKNIVQENIKNQIIKNMLCVNDFDVPDTLIEIKMDMLKNKHIDQIYSIENEYKIQSLYSLLLEDLDLEFQAKQHAKIMLMLNAVIQDNNIHVDYESIPEFLKKILDHTNDSKKFIKSAQSNVIIKKNIGSILLESMAIDLIMQRAQMVEKQMTFNELINLNRLKFDYFFKN